MYVLEGRGGPGNSMDQFYQLNQRDQKNDGQCKILYNPEIRFQSRLYMKFNCAIKLVKMRGALSMVVQQPDIYLRSKVPEEMYSILSKFAEMRKQSRASLVRDFDLFPDPEAILEFELKYGDALTQEDITGLKSKKLKIKK